MPEAKLTPATRAQIAQQSPALEAMIHLLLWLSPTIEKFPRSDKFTLGDRIETTALDARRYEHVMRRIDEVGRLTGGWMKADTGRRDHVAATA